VSTNASNTEPAELIAVFVADEGAELTTPLIARRANNTTTARSDRIAQRDLLLSRQPERQSARGRHQAGGLKS
jgi:hypothetical protein